MEMAVNLLMVIEIVIFLRRIMQVGFHKNKLRLLVACIILIYANLLCSYASSRAVSVILGNIVGNSIGIILLFDEVSIIKAYLKKEFATVYVGLLHIPFVFNSIVNSIWVLVFLYLVIGFLRKHRRILLYIKEIPTGYYCASIAFGWVVSFLAGYIRHLQDDGSNAEKVFISVILLLLVIFTYMFGIGALLLAVRGRQYKYESEFKDKYLQMSKSYYNELADSMKKVRLMKHDMNAHLKVIGGFIEGKDLEAAGKYFADMNLHYDMKRVRLINVGNVFVSAILTEEFKQAGDDSIIIDCNGVLPEEPGISNFALCTIFSNLITNSIEACKRLKNSGKRIKIKIKVFNNNLAIVFENPIEWEVDVTRLGEYTTKKDTDNHGLGLYNVRRAVEEYNGEMKIEATEDMFKISIFIPDKDIFM